MSEPVAVSVPRRPTARRQGRDALWIACFVAFAGTLGAILHVTAAVPPESAALAAVGTLAALLAVHAIARRAGHVSELNAEIEHLRGEIARLRHRQGAPSELKASLGPRPAPRPMRTPAASAPHAAARQPGPPAVTEAGAAPVPTEAPAETERTEEAEVVKPVMPRTPASDSDMAPFWALRPGTHKEPIAPVREPGLPMPEPMSSVSSRGAPAESALPSLSPPVGSPEAGLLADGAPRGMARLEDNEWPRAEPRVPTSPLDLDTMQNIVEQLTGKFGATETSALVAAQRAAAAPAPVEPSLVAAEHAPAPPLASRSLPPVAARANEAPVGHLALIAEAVEAERLDVCLDPILKLDDRRARHFELSVNLLTPSGEAIAPDHYRSIAAGTGLLARLDAAKLARAAAVLLRLRARGSDAALFSAVAGESLADENFGGIFVDTLAAEEGLGTHLVLTFEQAEARNFTEAHRRVVADMAAIGLRFALTGVTDLDMDFDAMRRSGFEFVKLDASVFLEGLPIAGGHIPAADICRYFAGLGLGLIVGGIVAERDLAKIMGFGAVLGQGTLFGGPRSVEVERNERRAA